MGIPVAAVQAIVDEMQALIDAETPSNTTTIHEGQGGSLTFNGNVWTFGAHVNEYGATVLRDGTPTGLARRLIHDPSNNTLWAEANPGNWWKYNGSIWIDGRPGPP